MARKAIRVDCCGSCPFISAQVPRYCLLALLRKEPDVAIDDEGEVADACPLSGHFASVALSPEAKGRLRAKKDVG